MEKDALSAYIVPKIITIFESEMSLHKHCKVFYYKLLEMFHAKFIF